MFLNVQPTSSGFVDNLHMPVYIGRRQYRYACQREDWDNRDRQTPPPISPLAWVVICIIFSAFVYLVCQVSE